MKTSMYIALGLMAAGCSSEPPVQPATAVPAAELRIHFRADNQTLAMILLRLEGDFATTKVAEEREKFNLKEMSWFDQTTGQWVTLEQCKVWATQSKESSLTSADSAPAQIRPFLLWSLDPTFNVTKSSGTLRLTSGQVDYVIEGEASSSNVDGYFRYAELNAYKKAIIERKLPPYAELKAIEEMKRLGHIPRRISVTIPGVPGSPALDMEITQPTE